MLQNIYEDSLINLDLIREFDLVDIPVKLIGLK